MDQYMKDLRAAAGHIPILICGASVIVENERGQILLLLRNDNHCWGYPGGAVDINEVVEDAAKRELYEETGLKALSIELFGIYSGKDMYHIYPNQDEISIVDIVYVCREYEGEIRPDHDESDCLEFYDIDALPGNISGPCRRAIQDYISKKKDIK